jgi:hypothetical protein
MTMPSPDGCFVRVWDGLLIGGSDYINGPRYYPSLRDMPGGRLWNNRILSAKVGPAAIVTAWADASASNQEGKASSAAASRRVDCIPPADLMKTLPPRLVNQRISDTVD